MAEYVPDNLDAFNAWDREQERRSEIAEYGLPRCPICDEVVYPGDGIYDPESWETIHKGECLRVFLEDSGELEDALEAFIIARGGRYE